MDVVVVIAIVVAFVGLVLAVRGRYHRTTGGVTDRADPRPDHPGAR